MYGGKCRLEIRWVRCPARPGLRPRPAHRSEYRNRPCPRCNLHRGQGLLFLPFSSASAGDRNRNRRPLPVRSGQKKKPLTPMRITPRTRAILKFQWRMSRRKPVRRTTQKYNFIGGVCRLTYTSDRLFSCFRYSHNGIRQWCWAFLRLFSHHTFQGSS